MTARESARKKQRRRRKRVIALILLAVLCAALFFCITVFFKVEMITVTGDTRYTAEEIMEAAAISPEKNIFSVAEKDVQQRIQESCPYVAEVRVHRRLPETVELEIAEYDTVYACIGSLGRITTLNEAGLVLEQCAALPQATCILLGADFTEITPGEMLPEEWSGTFSALKNVLTALENAGMAEEVGYIDISDALDLHVMVRGRILLKLGTDYDIDSKLLAARTVMDTELGDGFTGYVDVAVSGRVFTRAMPLAEIADAQYLAIVGGGSQQNM